jgi:hypothetical protein
MGRRSVGVLFDEAKVTGCRSTLSSRISSFTEVHEEKIRGSCSHPVGRAGARRGDVVRATERKVGVKSGGVKGESEVKGEERRSEGRLLIAYDVMITTFLPF